MPEEFQKVITIELKLPVRQKPNGVYEVRYRKQGYNIEVSSKDYDLLKPKFLNRLLTYREPQPREPLFVPAVVQSAPRFVDVCERWLELRRPTIKPATFGYYVQLFGASIYPQFLGSKISDVKQSDIIALINRYVEQGNNRAATKI